MVSIGSPRNSEPLAEAALRVEAACRLTAAQLTEPGWDGDPFVIATILEHLDRAARWLDVATWAVAA